MSNDAPIRNKSDEIALDRGYYWDPAGPARVKKFLTNHCVLSKTGALMVLVPWQDVMIDHLYGWRQPDGLRRFRTGYAQLTKKSGKTSMIAGLCNYHLLGDHEKAAEVVCGARVRKQASLVFDESVAMVKASKSLKKHLRVVPYQKRIVHEASNSVFQVLSSDADSADGINMSFGICDELHVWDGIKRRLFDNLRQAGRSRRQPLLLAITTAGRDRSGVCYEQYKHSKKVEAGIIDDLAHFSMIYEASPDDQWDDPETWRKANPSIGYTMTMDSIAIDAKKAASDPAAKEEFLQKTLNIWLSKESTWIKAEVWDACDGPASIPHGTDVYLGIDLSATSDITAVVMIALIGDRYHVVPKFWIPADEAELRNDRDGISYRAWRDAGLVDFIPGSVIDYDYISNYIFSLSKLYNVKMISMDTRFAGQMYVDLLNNGFDEEHIRKVPQGFGMSPWIKETERLIAQGKIRHGDHKLLSWMCSNTICWSDSSLNKKLVKPAPHSAEKIDGMVALVMAFAGAIESGADNEEASEWDGRIIWA